jgi:hypothetical protein
MGLFSKNTEPPKPPEERLEITEKVPSIDSYIVASFNKFDTRFLTLLDCLSKNKESIVKNGKFTLDARNDLVHFLDLDNVCIDITNFIFWKEYIEALIHLENIIPIPNDIDLRYKYDNELKSLIVYLVDNDISITFDFYTIPDKMNSVLKNLDQESSSWLEEYINNQDIKTNNTYLNINYKNGEYFERSITMPYNVIDTSEKYLLESILIKTFRYCKYHYNKTLKNIIKFYTGKEIESVYHFLSNTKPVHGI